MNSNWKCLKRERKNVRQRSYRQLLPFLTFTAMSVLPVHIVHKKGWGWGTRMSLHVWFAYFFTVWSDMMTYVLLFKYKAIILRPNPNPNQYDE